MKIVGVIPARYASTRFPGKPLADICGKPMIWWVYQQVKKVKELNNVYVATDSIEIAEILNAYKIPCIMTQENHSTVFARVCEFSQIIQADFYVMINGDEPLINPKHISAVIPNKEFPNDEKIAINTITQMDTPAEVIDSSNIKVVFDKNNKALYMSRTPIPFPNKRIDFTYWKHIGITGLSKAMLDAYATMSMGVFEGIEGIDHMRLIDAGETMIFVKIDKAETLSVDTPKDLEKVRKIIQNRIDNGEINQ